MQFTAHTFGESTGHACRFFGPLQNGPGLDDERFARGGQRCAARSPLQQLRAQFVFEILNLPAERGLGHA